MIKSDITKKIINIKYKNIYNDGGFMNNYKFKEQINNKSKDVEKSFDFDEKKNNFNEVMDNIIKFGFIGVSNDIQNISLEENVMVELDREISNYFTYPNIFSKDEIREVEINLIKYFNTIDSIQFELKLLEVRKNNALRDFDISSAVNINDYIFNANEKLTKTINDIKIIAKNINEKEHQFVLDYNQFLLDIKEGKIEEDDFKILHTIYSKVVIDEYKINLIIYLLNKYFIDIYSEEVIGFVNNNVKLKEFLKDLFPEFLNRINYVGKDN